MPIDAESDPVPYPAYHGSGSCGFFLDADAGLDADPGYQNDTDADSDPQHSVLLGPLIDSCYSLFGNKEFYLNPPLRTAGPMSVKAVFT